MAKKFSMLPLEGLVSFKTGKLNSNAAIPDGKFPFFTCSRETYRTNTWSFDGEYVLLAGNNAAGIYPLKYFNGRFDAYQRTYAIRSTDKKKILTRYAYYALILKLDLMKSISTGVATKFLTLRLLNQTEISCPPLPTQRKIVTILSAYDDLIENNLRRIKILEEMAQNLYREWFVKFRFPGHQNTRFVDSPLGKIPSSWEVQGAMENKNWSFLRENISHFSCTKRYFATADIDAITITGEGIPYTYPDKPSRAQKQPTLWSVWFARMQETYKVLGIAQSNAVLSENCMLSSGFAGFESVDKESFAFLFLTIKSENFHREKDRFCTGATQRSLTNDGLSRIQTISPPREIVRKFGGGGGMCKSH